MANYFIIGGDGRQYGPITADDIRKWVAEGRLNAESSAKPESDAEWRSLGKFPEFADLFGPVPGAENPSLPPLEPVDWQKQDYELDLGESISGGWNLMKDNFATLFLSFLIAILLIIAVGFVLGASLTKIVFGGNVPGADNSAAFMVTYNFAVGSALTLFTGPLMGGCYLIFLKVIRREPTGPGEIFEGFKTRFGPLFLGALVVSILVRLCSLPASYLWQSKLGPIFVSMQLAKDNPDAVQKLLPQILPALASVLPVTLICMIPATYLTVSLMFTPILIIDKKMSFGTAMKTSWKMVNKHWWLVFTLTLLAGLVSLAGLLGCCIGILFTLPIGLAITMVAYESIFSQPQKA